jgi:uncharacterized protein
MNPAHPSRRQFLKTALWSGAALCATPVWLPAAPAAEPGHEPLCHRPPQTRFQLAGCVAPYLAGVTEQWLKIAPRGNPAMLAMFADRDRLPRRELVPWAGEFAGKYLTAATLMNRVRRDPELQRELEIFVARFTALQAEDGYLGPWPKDSRLTGHAPNAGDAGGPTWDAWGHYHAMIGLLLWHEDTQDARALACARRIGDLVCRKFAVARLVDTGSTEMNLALIHSLCLLYRRTQDPKHLAMARKILAEFAAQDDKGAFLAGDYLNSALAGKEFFQTPKPRWESLHPIMGLAELYWLTGDARCRQAFERIWWSIVKLDRHNNGGFSSGEQAQGNPYHPGAIETCCTVAWTALGVDMLRLTGNSVVADELELSTLNSVLGYHSPTGRWVTYNTPMDGVRKASAHEIVFQARAGAPELNCCSVNGARGLGMIGDWALLASDDSLILNWYGPSTLETQLPSGVKVKLRQKTEYPRAGNIRLEIEPEKPTSFGLKLRVPHWSRNTTIALNGAPLAEVTPGAYARVERRWRKGDQIDIHLDFSFHYWRGEQECAGKASLYQGPILLTYDRRFNDLDPADIPALDARGLTGKPVVSSDPLPPILLLEFRAANGRAVRLCDFASAGADGSPYRSWLEIKNAPQTEFSPNHPWRTSRAS